jgi:ribonuclease HI
MIDRQDKLPFVRIYSDGACDPNPGSGGWAALLRYGGKKKELSGFEPETTNNRMELTAAIQGLKELNKRSRVEFFTDSMYLKNGITEWMPNWKSRNWKKKGGALKNIDLWQELDQQIQHHVIDWHWIRGHSGIPDNQRVDWLARQEIRRWKG